MSGLVLIIRRRLSHLTASIVSVILQLVPRVGSGTSGFPDRLYLLWLANSAEPLFRFSSEMCLMLKDGCRVFLSLCCVTYNQLFG